jgi:hypothetical protein
MKVVIAGSRTIVNYADVVKAIEKSNFPITEVVCGCAMGVDRLGQQWAISKGVAVKEMPANWNKHGKAAGPIRNKEMAEYADAAIIVWDGYSKGALNMIQQIKKVGKPYFIDVVNDEVTN